MKSCMLFPPSFSSQGPVRTRRRSDNSQEDLKLESVLSFFLTATSANAIVKKMGAEIAQLLLTHAYQVRNPKDFYGSFLIFFFKSCLELDFDTCQSKVTA